MQLHRPDFLIELEERDAVTLVVSFAEGKRLGEWVPWFRQTLLEPEVGREQDLFRRTLFLSDPSLTAYRAYGLGRHPLWTVWKPAIVWQYIQWAFQGKPIRRSPEDKLRKGGDFVIADGRITYVHVGHDPSDRPKASTLLGTIPAVSRTVR